MRQRYVDPGKYTEKMREALSVILDDCDPERPSSRRAAKQLYEELRKLMPLAGAGAVIAEAVWVGRNEYPFSEQRARRLLDHLILAALSVPMKEHRLGRA